MNRLLLAAVLALSLPAAARTLSLRAPGGIDLESQTAVARDLAEADVVIGRTIEAKHGIRRPADPGFGPLAALVLDTPYEVRDSLGKTYRLWLRSVRNEWLVFEILPPGDAPVVQARRAELAGRYQSVSMSVNGVAGEAHFPDLRIDENGTYRLGSIADTYVSDGRRVYLAGHYGTWGPAEISDGGHQLTFRFTRGAASFEIQMRTPDPVAGAVAQRR
jgi:hypothetical protein